MCGSNLKSFNAPLPLFLPLNIYNNLFHAKFVLLSLSSIRIGKTFFQPKKFDAEKEKDETELPEKILLLLLRLEILICHCHFPD